MSCRSHCRRRSAIDLYTIHAVGQFGHTEKVKFSADYASPENNQSSPLAGPPLVLAPLYSTAALDTSESAVTPKVGLSYQMNPNNPFYATAAKGFRPPGASQRVPVTCDVDVPAFGYVDANGNPKQPLQYKSDSVWSYELGTKNRLLGGRVSVDASAYQIKWKDIQTSPNNSFNAYSYTNTTIRPRTIGLAVSYRY